MREHAVCATGWVHARRAAAARAGLVSREKLSPPQWARLELELRKGPLAHGFSPGPSCYPEHPDSGVS